MQSGYDRTTRKILIPINAMSGQQFSRLRERYYGVSMGHFIGIPEVFWMGAYEHLRATGISQTAEQCFQSLLQESARPPGVDWKLTHPWLADLQLPGGTKLREYQCQAVAALTSGDLLLGDDMGLGKAQPLTSKVLTPGGWRELGSIKVGDFVTCPISGGPIEVTGVYPQHGCLPVWQIGLNDRECVECSADHLWTVQVDGNWVTLTTTQLKEILPNSKSILLPEVTPPQGDYRIGEKLHPYLLGIYLGDGSGCNTITTSDHEELITIFNELLPDDGELVKASSTYDWKITSKKFVSAIKANGLEGKRAWEKFVPRKYLLSEPAVRLAVLQGLLDTDGGSVSASGIKYTTTSERLCEDVKYLVRSLGGYCWSKFEPNAHRGSWRVYIWMGPEYLPFRLKRRLAIYTRPTYKEEKYRRKIVSVEELFADDPEEMVCISVNSPHRLYITDNMVVTHNTLSVLTARQMLVQNYGMAQRTLVCVPQQVVADEWRRMAWEHWRIPVHVIDKPQAVSKKMAETLGIWVITYSKVWRDNYRQAIMEFLQGCPKSLLVCDEAHALAGYTSRQSMWVQHLSQFASMFWALSGTEVASMPDSYWAMYTLVTRQAHLEEVGLLPWVSYLTDGLTEADGATPKWSEEKCKSIATVRNLFALRRLKSDVAKDLPPVTGPIIHMVPMTPVHRRCYEQLWNESKFEFQNQLDGAQEEYQIDSFCARYIRLYQVCTYPYLLPELAECRDDLRPTYKLERLISLLQEAGDQKAVVWCSFPRAIEWLAQELQRQFPKKRIAIAHGGVSQAERSVIRENFQAGNYDLLIANPAIWGQGVTLTAASVFIYWDIHPSRVRWAQSKDRGNRIGQLNPVTIIVLLHSDSCEVMTMNHLMKKEYYSSLLTTGQGTIETLKTHSKFTPMVYKQKW